MSRERDSESRDGVQGTEVSREEGFGVSIPKWRFTSVLLHVGQSINFVGFPTHRKTDKEDPFFFIEPQQKRTAFANTRGVSLGINDTPVLLLKSRAFVYMSGMCTILHVFPDTQKCELRMKIIFKGA